MCQAHRSRLQSIAPKRRVCLALTSRPRHRRAEHQVTKPTFSIPSTRTQPEIRSRTHVPERNTRSGAEGHRNGKCLHLPAKKGTKADATISLDASIEAFRGPRPQQGTSHARITNTLGTHQSLPADEKIGFLCPLYSINLERVRTSNKRGEYITYRPLR